MVTWQATQSCQMLYSPKLHASALATNQREMDVAVQASTSAVLPWQETFLIRLLGSSHSG